MSRVDEHTEKPDSCIQKAAQAYNTTDLQSTSGDDKLLYDSALILTHAEPSFHVVADAETAAVPGQDPNSTPR